MKYTRLFLILFGALLLGATAAFGQEGLPPGDGPREERSDDRRPNLLAELGLSPEQLQQIGRMNQERRPAIRQARRRMGDAARSLDMAIYGDAVNDAEVKLRLKEFQEAETELSRLRFESELSVRKIITPEQLVRFRDIRRQFAEERKKDDPNRRMKRNGGGGPFRRPPNE